MAIVLVVDDEQQVRETTCKALQLAGHTPLSAGSASEALRIARTERPALLVLDLRLSTNGADGLELFRILRRERPDTLAARGESRF